MRVSHRGKRIFKDLGGGARWGAGGGRIGRCSAPTMRENSVSSRCGRWGSGAARGALRTGPPAWRAEWGRTRARVPATTPASCLAPQALP